MNSKPAKPEVLAVDFFAAFVDVTNSRAPLPALPDLPLGEIFDTSDIDLVWIVFDAPKVMTAPKMAIKPVPITIFLRFWRAYWMKAREYDERPL